MKKINLGLIAVFLVMLCLSSCSKDNQGTQNGEISNTSKNVEVTIQLGAMSTKAAGVSASGLYPDVSDLTLYFCNSSGIIVSQQSFTTPIGATHVGSQTFTVPSNSTQIYAVGNQTSSVLTITAPTIGITNITDLQKSQIVLANQTHPQTGVNIKGRSSIISTGTPATYSSSLKMKPAVARIEIAKIESTSSVKQPLTSFQIAGIYINNTYTTFGLDEKTKGSTEINYGPSSDATNPWPATWSVASFSDESGAGLNTTGTSHTPGTSNVWGYFVPATVANSSPLVTTLPGTVINGVQYDAVPHIILKIKDAQSSSVSLPVTSTTYVTIRGLYKSGTSTKITNLEAGNYYLIKSINIGAEHLSSEPEDPNIKVDVNVEVLKWEEVLVEPEL